MEMRDMGPPWLGREIGTECGRGIRQRQQVFWRPDQQPGGCAGDTPGVAAAPVALAGAIMPGVERLIVTLSAQADVLGVGTAFVLMPGSMLVSASCATGG